LSSHLAQAKLAGVKLLLENLPLSLHPHRDALVRCLEAMDRVLPLKAVYLFGSHARGEAHPDSDVDLCLVAEGATEQLKTAQQFRKAISEIRPKPAFSLLPIAPQRLREKQTRGDDFFQTVLREGVKLAA
jgi:predicted nucleotidyltransferase